MQPANQPTALRDALVGQVLQGSGGVSYYLRERIGEGGQGWVFKANWDEPTGMVVIVKVLRPDAVHGESLPRFQREAEVLRLLSQQPRPNPHIVRFYDHAIAHFARPGTTERLALPFTVLEYVHGPTLEQVLRPLRGNGLPVERVRRIVRQVVHALELVHAQKVVHRDLKPSNILLATEQGAEVAKVTDFGLVKLVDINVQRTTTLAGASLGYAPPEQYETGNQRVTPRTDVFSLAAIVYEMLSGSPAFPFAERDNPLIVVSRILNDPRPSLLAVRTQLFRGLREKTEVIEKVDAVLARGLRGNPDQRQESVTELWAELEPLLRSAGGLGDSAPPSKLAFADTDLARTRPSIDHVAHQTLVSGPPAAGGTPSGAVASGLPASYVKVNPIAPQAATPSGRNAANASNPAAWAASVITKPIRPGLVRGAAFGQDGESAVGTGPSALARWERGAWAGLALPPHIDSRLVRGVRYLPNGELLVFGERALAARLGPGVANVWAFSDREPTFLAAHVDRDGTITLVGERPIHRSAGSQGEAIGHVAQLSAQRIVFAADAPTCTRLRGVTRMFNGPIVACGDWGNIARIDGGSIEHAGAICQGHLAAIAPLEGGGAVTVGAGGHALRLSPRLEPSLEAVQTTRDLTALAIGSDGVAWAGAVQARLLRRSPDAWVRISGDVGITPSIVAIWASDRVVRAICDDAAVIEWRLS
jgi:serine/threonine protein kinase